MRSRTIATLIVTAVAILGAALLPRVEASSVRDAEGCPDSGELPTPERLHSTRAAILCLMNRERAGHGLAPLTRNALLEVSSQRHSDDMAARDFFAHHTPNGVDPGARMAAAGYPVTKATTGENLAWGSGPYATPVRIVQSLMESPGHRENILRPQFAEVGVGIAHEAPKRGVEDRVGVYTTNFGGVPYPAPIAP
jgi:uncharacterized protein YkwD